MKRVLAVSMRLVLGMPLLVWAVRKIRRYISYIPWQVRAWKRMIDELFYMAGYTELITRAPIDEARGITATDSKVGLFKENREIGFYWFIRHGRVRHSNVFRLNNYGLISQKTYELARSPGEYRIVVLGDEMTAATTAEVSWPDWLQDLLCSNAALLKQLGKTRFSVINFGWPDAGFAHLASVWRDKAKSFDPDLVLVNIAAHNFCRYSTGARLFFRGRVNSDWRHEYVTYTSPAGLQAWLAIICVGSGRDLASPDCTSPRPFALYLSKGLAENPAELAAVQDQIVRDYAGTTRVWRNLPRILRITASTTLDRLLGRAIETEASTPAAPVANAELVAHARTHLRTILDGHANVVFTYNPLWLQVLDPSMGRPWVEALTAADPAIEVIDMRAYLPPDVDGKEIESWYQVPHAAEKWSSKGHRIYATAQARLIAERLAHRLLSVPLITGLLASQLPDVPS
jgi:hypothetical protein